MPKNKNKKAKPSHNSRGKKDGERELSQAEIWDDSVLVRSWEEAVREYEYYHSLAARGVDVDAVLDAAEEAEENGENMPLALDGLADPTFKGKGLDGREHGEFEDGEIEDGEVEDGEVGEDVGEVQANPNLTNGASGRHGAHGLQHGPLLPSSHEVQQPTDTGTPQERTVNTEQTLENLKMAYYWAGYYSGLYEGQRQAADAAASASAKTTTSGTNSG